MNRRNSLVVLSLVLSSLTARAQSPDVFQQTWYGADSKTLAVGSLSGIHGSSVVIVRSDGVSTLLKSDSLSIADRAAALTFDDKLSEFQNPSRKWTSASGAYQVTAIAIAADETSVRLALGDGKFVSVPLEKLSKDDLSYIERLKKLLAQHEPNPFTPEQHPQSLDSFADSAPTKTKAASVPSVGQNSNTGGGGDLLPEN